MICRTLYLTTIQDVVPLQFTSTGNILSLTMFHNLFWSWMWFLVFYSFLDHITLLLLLLFPLNAIAFLLLPALALDAKISLFGFFLFSNKIQHLANVFVPDIGGGRQLQAAFLFPELLQTKGSSMLLSCVVLCHYA